MDGQHDAAGTRLGALIRGHRRAAGLTQQQLADRSRLSVAAVRDLEQGRSRRPRTASLAALARALELDGEQSAVLAAAGKGSRLALEEAGRPAGHRVGLWLTVLGPLAAWRDGVPLPLGPPRQAAVLALLAVQPGDLVRRETIIDVLWGGLPPATSADLVQAQVSRLSRVLAADGRDRLIEQGRAGYRLRAGPDELDAAAFQQLTKQAGKATAAGQAVAACGLYERALQLWRGEPAEDVWMLGDQPAVTDLSRRRVDAVVQYADAACGLGRHARVIPLLEALAQEDPQDERVHARLIVALAGSGQQAAAIEVHERLRRRLDQHLGIRPGPELAAAYQRVLRQDIPPPAAEQVAQEGKARNRRSAPAGPRPVLEARHSLPPDTPAFTGRLAELDRIAAATEAGGAATIHAISGMPGVGKTALAVHCAHLLKHQFPDRQLFLSLHAHTPGQQPVSAEAALAGLLTAIGVDARYLPEDLDGRSTLWRDRMAGQRALLVLDNAASSAQVSPLLPASEGCLVLVTSRRQLGDLPGVTASHLLEALPAAEAREMFARLAPRTSASPSEAVAELTELAGHLPLAISLLARVYARHPSWTLADLAAETRATVLTVAAENDSVAAAFGLSYQHLDPGWQEFFRRLSLHPGGTIDCYAGAALSGDSLDEAAGQLDALHREGLLTEVGRRRYAMHDLIRRYARNLAATDPGVVRQRALDRLLDYYEHAAARAEAVLARQVRNVAAGAPGSPPVAVPGMADAAEALAWARAERASLLACLDQVTATGQHARVVALTAAVASLLRLDGPWSSAVTRHTVAVRATQLIGDRPGQANALTDLGGVRRLTGAYHGAAEALQEALDIYRQVGDQQDQATALISLADVRLAAGDHPGAVKALREALTTYPGIGNRLGHATALTDLRGVRRLAGDHHSAAGALREALGLYRETGDQQGQATALTFLGVVRLAAGEHRDADAALHGALSIYRDLGHRLGVATALTYLGDARQTAGDHHAASEALREALAVYRDIGHQLGQATALTYLGGIRRVSQDHHGASEALTEALSIYRGIGDRGGEAMVLNETGALHQARGDSSQATECHGQALHVAREITSPWDEAHALAGLGHCALVDGLTTSGTVALRQARDIFQRIGTPEAENAARELATSA